MNKTPLATPADLARAKRRREVDMYRPIIEAFAARGIYLERRNAGMTVLMGKGGKKRVIRVGSMGTPDLMGWTERWVTAPNGRFDVAWRTPPGTVVAVEVKQPGQVATAMQEAYLRRVMRAGGLAFVIRSPQDVFDALIPCRAELR